MQIETKWILRFYRDPVLAAYVFFNARLDAFQRARLRYLWFVPNKVDSSGWSTGKTVVEWIYGALRAILIPDQRVGVYYPIFQIGKDEFWSKINDFRTPQFQAQLIPGQGGESKASGCWALSFKNGSMIQMPAPGFTKDAQTQVSRRFNTMIIGEYTKAAEMGQGIDELIGRVSRQSWNQNHPIWTNHILYSAHAESPVHPAFPYYKAVRDAGRGKKSQRDQHRNVVFSFCYLDWTDRPIDPKNPAVTFRKRYRDNDAVSRSKNSSGFATRKQTLLGLWSTDGKGWYSDELIGKLLSSDLVPILERGSGYEEAIFSLGLDVAPGLGGKSDLCATTVYCARPAPPGRQANYTGPEGDPYLIHPVYAHIFKNLDAPQISGFIHDLHQRFGFAVIVPDPGGGGAWVYKELRKEEQTIHGVKTRVVPLCTADEPMAHEGQPIVTFFKRGSELDALWQRNFLASDDGIVEAAHRLLQEQFQIGLPWPQLLRNRAPAQARSLTTPQRFAQIHLDTIWRQLTQINVKTVKGPDGQEVPMKTARGFYSFHSKIKKDGAYSAVYAYCGIRLALHRDTTNMVYEDAVV